jgi:hypothetical protein
MRLAVGKNRRPYPKKITKAKKGWECGLSGRAPVCLASMRP